MFVKDKVEQKPKEELSNEELIEGAQWLWGLYEEFLKELRRRGAWNAERAKLQKMALFTVFRFNRCFIKQKPRVGGAVSGKKP